VVLFSNNPFWRAETKGSYFLVFNAILNFDKVGIHLTQVATTCSMASDGGFPTGSPGIRGSLFDGSGLPGVSVSAPLA
jgi:hypothetical protein